MGQRGCESEHFERVSGKCGQTVADELAQVSRNRQRDSRNERVRRVAQSPRELEREEWISARHLVQALECWPDVRHAETSVQDVRERADRQRVDFKDLQAFVVETIEHEQTRLSAGAPREQHQKRL